jgi:hypothetical protein
MVTPEPFTCPKCGGHYYGSMCERRPDGSFWKIAEECHDQHGVGCKYVEPKEVLLIAAKHFDQGTWQSCAEGI